MPVIQSDYYGHLPQANNGSAAALVAAAAGATNAGTVAPINAGAGAGSAVSAVAANDTCGSFTLTPAGTPAAGAQVQVLFANPYASAPRHVAVFLVDQAAASTPILVGYGSLTAAGFTVTTAAALTAAHNYTISYAVFV